MFAKTTASAIRHPSSWVFLFVLVASLGMAFTRTEPSLSNAQLAWILFLSLVYLVVGTFGFHFALESGSPGLKIAYLVFQICLGMLILYLSRGNGWLVMLPLASHSVALFSPREAVLPCVLITLGIAWNTSQMLPDWIPFLQSALVFGSAVFFAAAFTDISIRDARRREEVERLAAQLEAANRTLRAASAKAEELAALQERNRLAREIHDGLGHYLTAMTVQAEVVRALITPENPEAGQALVRLQAMLSEALADVRRSVAALRSQPILGRKLADALGELAAESRAAGLETELALNGQARDLPPVLELTLYRAVQEGLTNVRKHAQARRALVRLAYSEDEVRLCVQDDGIGCETNPDLLEVGQGGFGLFGLRERVGLAGGEMHIQTAPQRGFCLEIRLPVWGA